MIDAGMVIGFGVSLFGLGVAINLGVSGWLSLKKFERENRLPGGRALADAELERRLERIEQIVEATAIEVERVTEGQRFVTRALTERNPGRPAEPQSAERVITPH